MQVNNTTQTSNTTQAQNNTNANNSNGSVFSIESLLNKDPKEITFKEYQKLSKEDIEKLYPKESMPKEYAKAIALHTKVTISDDEILNEVLFEKELHVKDYEIGQRALGMVDFLSKTWDLATSFESYELTDKYMQENNIPFSKEKFAQIQQKMEKTIEYDYNKKMTADELFKIFDNNKLGYEAYIEFYNYTPQDAEYQEYQAQITYRESIKIAYEQKVNEQNAVLASYTRTNTTNPANKLEETNIPPVENKTDPKDTKLFKSITEDNYVSYDEIKNLSYEQIVQIKDFVMKKDENENYIQNSFMDHDKKAGMLLGTTAISGNDTFNKAIFNIARKIDDEKIFETFIYDMTGTQFSDKLMAYPEFQEIDYTKQDVKEYISKKMDSYQIKLDLTTNDEEKEFYQGMINTLQGLTNNYKSLKGENIHEEKADPLEKLRALVEDILSMFRTGYTVEELEYIEKLLEQIRKLLKEQQEGKNDISKEDIEKQIKTIEEALLALEKRLNGVAIIEMDDESVSNNDDGNSSFKSRLDTIQKKVDEMKNGKYNQPINTSSDDEEKQEEEKEW